MSRYSRQELFGGVGPAGQEKLGRARVAVVGCGALGSVLSETLVRSGVGSVTVIDRDLVEASNLQRQSLFDESDVERALPKAVAAQTRLRRINSEVEVRGVVADLAPDNAAELLRGAELVLDGTDNFETRFLLNDLAVRDGFPWIYGACVAAYGIALLVRPGRTPCLKCLLEEMPAPGSGPTCDTAGVVAPIVHVVAGVQAGEALKLLAGDEESLLPGVFTADLWEGRFDVLDLSRRRPSCPACTERRFDHADASGAGLTAALCGRDAVQVRPAPGTRLDLDALAERLGRLGRVRRHEYLVRFSGDDAEIVVFEDGRALVKGVASPARARSVYARYVGS